MKIQDVHISDHWRLHVFVCCSDSNSKKFCFKINHLRLSTFETFYYYEMVAIIKYFCDIIVVVVVFSYL